MENIKFMYNGIKINGKLVKGFWSKGGYTNGAEIAFYAKEYSTPELKEIFNVKNDTDIMTDYFETDTIYFMPDDKYIEEARAAFIKKETRLIEKQIKHYESRLQKKPNDLYAEQELKFYTERLNKLVA